MMVHRDPTEFRKRFQAWKDGKDVYEAGRPIELPRYSDGKPPYEGSIDFIIGHEGSHKDKNGNHVAYQVNGDKRTIGYGTTNPKYVNRGVITEAEARLAIMEDVEIFERSLRDNIPNFDIMPKSQKTVLRDIIYNVGEAGLYERSPKFMQALRDLNWLEAARLMDWDNNKPGFSKGARARNKHRLDLWLSEITPSTTLNAQSTPSYKFENVPSIRMSTDVNPTSINVVRNVRNSVPQNIIASNASDALNSLAQWIRFSNLWNWNNRKPIEPFKFTVE